MTELGSIRKTADLLNRELLERDAAFPERYPENDRRVRELLLQFVSGINELSSIGTHSTPGDVHLPREFREKCVFLCGYMKCGTTLLLGLLDNHPELVALPGDSWFKGRRYLDCENAGEVHGDCFRDKWLGRIVNPTGQSPFWLFGREIKPYIDFVSHYGYWYEKLADKRKGHLTSVLLSYYSANPYRVTNPRFWIEKTPGNEFETERILNYFPNARFVHIVRDPRENFASLKRLYTTRKWNWEPLAIAERIGESCRQAVKNQMNLGKERYLILDYEQLTSNLAESLLKIAEYIGIEWDNSLQIPTVNGFPAQANSMYSDRKVTGVVRPAVGNKWMSVLSDVEKRAILCTLKDAELVGYHWDLGMGDRLLHHMERITSRVKIGRGVNTK